MVKEVPTQAQCVPLASLMGRSDAFISFVYFYGDSEKENAERALKRRKIVTPSPAASQTQTRTQTPAASQARSLSDQPSFADVLQRLKEESEEGTGVPDCNCTSLRDN